MKDRCTLVCTYMFTYMRVHQGISAKQELKQIKADKV